MTTFLIRLDPATPIEGCEDGHVMVPGEVRATARMKNAESVNARGMDYTWEQSLWGSIVDVG